MRFQNSRNCPDDSARWETRRHDVMDEVPEPTELSRRVSQMGDSKAGWGQG